MNDKLRVALISALKNLVIVLLAGLAVVYGKSDWYILLAPALKFIEKLTTYKEEIWHQKKEKLPCWLQ